jgi:uncharacterized protein YpmB
MNNRGFIGLIGLLLTVAIISVFAYFIFTKYFGKPTGMDQNTQEMADQAGIDTTSQTSILGSVKFVIKGVNEAQQENGYN